MAPALFACALLATILGGAFPALAWLAMGPEWLGRYLLWAARLAADAGADHRGRTPHHEHVK